MDFTSSPSPSTTGTNDENVIIAGPSTVDPNTEVKLVNVSITDENVALNVMVSFLNLGHRRGVFSLDESAKIFECVKKFQKSA
jgi:hypothetical protein